MIAVGIDVGGTSIKGAFVNEKGEILDRFSMKVDKKTPGEDIINSLCDIIEDLIKEKNYQIDGVGIGLPGLLDIDNGVVIDLTNLPLWEDLHIAEIVSKRLHTVTKINNDANVAALGEAKFGSASQYRNSIMITLGTGVGGGIIIDGKLYDGNKHQGGELGHMVIKVGGRKCGCGRNGCFEAYASATGLIKSTLEAMEKHPESLLHEVEKELQGVDARNAFIAARRGDLVATDVVNEYVMYLSEGLLNYSNALRPEAFIISGGVANEGEYLFNKIRDYIESYHYGMPRAPKVDVVPASLGYDSGKIGAACLILFK